MDNQAAAEARKQKIRNLEFSLFGEKQNDVSFFFFKVSAFTILTSCFFVFFGGGFVFFVPILFLNITVGSCWTAEYKICGRVQ